MATEIILPKLGQTMEEGTIVEWLKQEGEPVKRGEVLFTTESDKATLEVESPTRGFLRRILVQAGETVPVLTVVALITRTPGEDISAYGEETRFFPKNRVSGRIFSSPRARKLARERGVDLALVTGTGPNGRIVERDVGACLEAAPKTTPVARRLAEQMGVDLRAVQGTGPSGRITKDDVEQAMAAATSPILTVPAETVAPVMKVPMTGVRAVIAQRMFEGHSATAPVTLTAEVDATAFVALREQLKTSLADELGFNLGYNDLLIKLVAHALHKFPYMNARLEGDDSAISKATLTAGTIRHLRKVHVALAVDTERGLLVPVVRDADRKGLAEVARELREVVERARAGKALPDELSGSTFTITNLGMYEIDAFTPIINLPEAAILGVGRIKARPAVVADRSRPDGEICVRQMMWLSLTFDHRLVDGAPAARFLQYIKSLIEEPYLWFAAVL
jgi:pyruvate dehydrogenase E2 component (dihydrolipoamide acetyltransferase)